VSPAHKKVVMVIEDDHDIRASLIELLEDWEFVPVPASDGEVALRLLREGTEPAVILLDLRMPGMTGWDFRRRQIADSRLIKIPVVVMTALGAIHESDAAKMGDVTWLRKPFDPPGLAQAIAAAARAEDQE
jgi:CheY-like chemotaxis protein